MCSLRYAPANLIPVTSNLQTIDLHMLGIKNHSDVLNLCMILVALFGRFLKLITGMRRELRTEWGLTKQDVQVHLLFLR
jgi:hypothetical protein